MRAELAWRIMGEHEYERMWRRRISFDFREKWHRDWGDTIAKLIAGTKDVEQCCRNFRELLDAACTVTPSFEPIWFLQ